MSLIPLRTRLRPFCLLLAPTAAVLLAGCAGEARPSAAEFTSAAEKTLMEHYYDGSRAAWVQSTYINEDTTALAARAGAEALTRAIDFAQEAATYDAASEADEVARKLNLLRGGLTVAAPADAAKIEELSQITTRMEAAYGTGSHCPSGPDSCRSLDDLEDVIDNSRDAAALLDAWEGWRTISPPMRADYQRFVELSNEGARGLGYDDTGAMWRSGYDMPPDDFAAETDRLWEQVKPLYDDLHCHVRAELAEQYGPDVVDPEGAIPAHVLGNMWAQTWSNVFDLVAPEAADPGYDLTEILPRAPDIGAGDGGDRRGLLHLARDGGTPRHVLAALPVPPAARPRRRLSRERLAARPGRGRPDQDVHPDQRRGLLDDPP